MSMENTAENQNPSQPRSSNSANQNSGRRNNNNNNNRNNHQRPNRGGGSGGGNPRGNHRPPLKTSTEVNMKCYGRMINQIEENFSDIKMTSNVREECAICCKACDIFGIGQCRHPVCIECSIRIRVIGKQNNCPVCRGELSTCCLVFAESGLMTTPLTIPLSGHADEERYGMRFQNKVCGERYEQYLAHICKKCTTSDGSRVEFPNFQALRQHMANVHSESYCHICTDHLNAFSRERKTYSREGLQRHIREGDKDFTSQKGHPKCLFCTERFYDDENQYRHLRKDHFFCQICDSNPDTSNMFFSKHPELLTHYKAKHFICEEGECLRMGIVFENKFQLDLHKSKNHSNVPFQIFGERTTSRHAPTRTLRGVQPPQPVAPPPPQREVLVVRSAQNSGIPLVGPSRNRFEAHHDFPSLSGSSAAAPTVVVPNDFPRLTKVGKNVNAPSVKKPAPEPVNDFPSLSTASSSRSTAPVENWKPPKASQKKDRFKMIDDDERIAANSVSVRVVPSAQPQSQASVKKQPVQKPPSTIRAPASDDFPSLPAPGPKSSVQVTSQWGKGGKSAIVGLQTNRKKEKKALPVPDQWPDRPTVTTPYVPPPTEEWKEIPVNKKPTKKERKEMQRKLQEEAEKHSAIQQEELKKKMMIPPDEDVDMQKLLMEDILAQSPSDIQSSSRAMDEVPIVTKVEGEEEKKSQKSKNKKKKTTTTDETPVVVNGNVAASNGFEERKEEQEQQNGTSVATADGGWFSSLTSAFSGISLSNILGDNTKRLGDIETTPKKLDSPVSTTPTSAGNLPPGLSVGVPSASAPLLAAPPGFEHVQPTKPPGLEDVSHRKEISPPPTTESNGSMLFSMAPFISEDDVRKPSVKKEVKVEDVDGWSQPKKR